MPAMKIVSGPAAGRTSSLGDGSIVRLGRGVPESEDAGALHLTIEDKRLSRIHCEIRQDGAKWIVRDLGSSNGTFVNGDKITERAISPGDLVQAGGTIFEIDFGEEAAGVEREFQPAAAPASASAASPSGESDSQEAALEAPPRNAPAVKRQLARGSSRRSFQGSQVIGYAVFLVGIGAAIYLGSRAIGGRKNATPPQAGGGAAANPTSPRPGSRSVVAERTASGRARPADDFGNGEEEALIASSLAAGDYHRALTLVDEILKGPQPGQAAALRMKVLDAAQTELAEEVRKAETFARAGDFDGARKALEDVLFRMPEDLAQEAASALESLRQLAEAKLGESQAEMAALDARRESETLRAAVQATFAAFQNLLEKKDAGPREWEAVFKEVRALVTAWHRKPGYSEHRSRIREMFITSRARSMDLAREGGGFSARNVEVKGGRLKLVYDFSTDKQLDDFHLVPGSGGVLKREGKLLLLRGECRLLTGNLFEKSLTVRGKVPVGGYDAKAPNINVALFTPDGARITDDSRPPPSLFNAFVRGTGPEPGDFAAFCLGYRAATAEYGGEKLEQITPPGASDPIKMPVHAVFAGTRGLLLHSDQRECLWVVGSAGRVRGAVDFEVALVEGKLSWKVNGKTVADGKEKAFARFADDTDRFGSVTLFTRLSEVRFASLEVEGILRRDGAGGRIARIAAQEFEELEKE